MHWDASVQVSQKTHCQHFISRCADGVLLQSKAPTPAGFAPCSVPKSGQSEEGRERVVHQRLHRPAAHSRADSRPPQAHGAHSAGFPQRGLCACRGSAIPQRHPARLRRHGGVAFIERCPSMASKAACMQLHSPKHSWARCAACAADWWIQRCLRMLGDESKKCPF